MNARTLTNSHGAVVRLIDLGATITELFVPDRDGKLDDVVLGFDTAAGYEKNEPYFGAVVGRVANRIAAGRFLLDGETYHIPLNNGASALHGGPRGFDKRVWQAEHVPGVAGEALRFRYQSPDGEEGFPGALSVAVTYTLSDHDELTIEYEAATDAPTIVNLTNHSYFNLAGAARRDVLEHVLTLAADCYTPVDATLLPTGAIAPVIGTPMDFTRPATIGSRIAHVRGGYDHNYVLRGEGAAAPVFAARVEEPSTGRWLEVYTTQPGVQFYSGNFLDGTVVGKRGMAYMKHGGFCLETQHFPDAINHPNFPSTVLRPGELYRHTTVYKFGAR